MKARKFARHLTYFGVQALRLLFKVLEGRLPIPLQRFVFKVQVLLQLLFFQSRAREVLIGYHF